jgi:hypothetical protein
MNMEIKGFYPLKSVLWQNSSLLPWRVFPYISPDSGTPVGKCVPLALVRTYENGKQMFGHA